MQAEAGAPSAGVPSDARVVVHAPGRVNLIGEHTDYNDGLVLPAAIDRGISIALAPRSGRRAALTRVDTGERIEVDLDDPGRPDGTWRDYLAGSAWALAEAGASLRAFDGVLTADLPIGAGLSSSAALELACALALGGGEPPIGNPMRLAQAARRGENEFVGVPSGLMDQFAVTFGRAGHALLLDCRSLQHEAVPLPPDVEIIVCDSGVERRLASSGYATRREECRRAVEQLAAVAPEVRSLRDATLAMLGAAREAMDAVAWRRARHVVTENARVLATVTALRSGDLAALALLFAASHASLRDDFEVSTPELDRLVELAASGDGCLGARLTGAGFGGAIVALVRRGEAQSLVDRLRAGYRTPSGAVPNVLRVRAADGARRILPA